MTAELLLVGGTGDLGGRIAARLAAHHVPFRALVRAMSDVTRLQSLGAELTVGDLTDRRRHARQREPEPGGRGGRGRAVRVPLGGRADRPARSRPVASNDVATDDVAEACVRLATMADPPDLIEIGGPEAMTRRQMIDALERAYGMRFRRFSVPRPVLRFGARTLRYRRPELASVLGMAPARDLEGCQVSPEPLRRLGIEPRAHSDYIAAMAGFTTDSRSAPASPTAS